MKQLLLILITNCFLYSAGFSQIDSIESLAINIKVFKQTDSVYPKKNYSFLIDREDSYVTTDSIRLTEFDVQITITNKLDREVTIWLMSCSWEENFIINNNYIFFSGRMCTANVPARVKFKPKEKKVYRTNLTKSIKFDYPCENCIYGPQVPETKFGLIVIDDIFTPKLSHPYDYELAMEDKSRWKIIWSNGVQLLTEKEVWPNPMMKEIIQEKSKKNN